MGRPTRQIKNYSSEQIKSLFNSEDRYKIGIRLYAVYQVSLGKSSRELEGLYNTSFKQILNWVSRFEQGGLEGLRDKPGRGRKCKLSQEQQQRLKSLVLEESPLSYGYNTATWNGPLLINWLTNNLGITYKRAQIYNVLKSLGLSYQKAKGFYPEADKKAQEKFKQELKKNFLKDL